MKSILPANTINMQILGMLKLVWLSKLLVLLFLVDININLVNANVSNHDNSYCGWIKSAALAIAQNKVNGFDEYKLIGKVLETNMDYKQQLVIIPTRTGSKTRS